ncbi:MAG: formate dehydrogenase subunit gamma [Burkholderiaceae bacterium]|nr:formate dehydrogenase subunit gamma [Burkholderiaceae bacterium]
MKRTIRALLVALGFSAAVAVSQSALAQSGGPQSANIFDPAREQVERQASQPLNNAPVWRAVNSGREHTTNIPAREAGVLIQSEGEQWRQLRPSLYSAGGALLAAVIVLLIAFYLIRGPIRVEAPLTGRMIERFSPVERIAHWTMAISFVVLGLTGLLLTFGKFLVLPVVGYTLFGWLASVAKNLHNFVAPVFLVSIPVFIVIFVRDNLPKAYDFKWLAAFGGLFGRGSHPPSGRFNGGEKLLFWGLVCLLSIVLIVSGLVMLFPNFEQTRQQMQLANTVHLITAMLGIAMALGHIYLGTIGQVGAYQAMRDGHVDETWAKEHHPLWYDDVKSGRARGATSPDRASGSPAAAGVPGHSD